VSKFINNSSIGQLSLFDITEFDMPRPAPLTDEPRQGFIRCKNESGEAQLCAIDTVMWAKDENYETARQSWKDAKTAWERDGGELVENIYQLKARAADGKMRDTDFINQEQLYRLAMELPGKKTARFKDAVAYILTALSKEAAKYGQSVMDYVRSGHANSWAVGRVDAKSAQVSVNSALKSTHESASPDYQRLAMAQNQALFNLSKQRIIVELDLTPSQSTHYRDFLSEYAQRAITDACNMAEKRLRRLGRALTDEEQVVIVMRASEIAARTARDTAAFMEEDYLSGDPVDKDGKRIPTRFKQPKLLK
jgi:hypothetical protein